MATKSEMEANVESLLKVGHSVAGLVFFPDCNRLHAVNKLYCMVSQL